MAEETALTAVFLHGIFSRGNPFSELIHRQREDEHFSAVQVEVFRYASPRLPPFVTRTVPNLDVLADQLETFLRARIPDPAPIYLVGHSQGGLVIQRMLARRLSRGQGKELSQIRGISLFACPNQGSDILLSLRRSFMGWNLQERSLRPFAEDASDAHRRVVHDIDQARELTPTRCPIPIRAYAGATDGVVSRPSAWGAFKDTAVLSGDHSSILRARTPDSDAWRALQGDLAGALAAPHAVPAGILVGQVPGEPQTFVERGLAVNLTEVLRSSRVVAVTALAGMRGVGKTQIAAAFAREAVAHGTAMVAWINAETADSLYAGLTRAAQRLSLPTEGLGREEIAAHLREYLATWEKQSLLVFDNAEDVELVRGVLPTTGTSQIIITTTNRRFDDVATTLDISTFERRESVDYLLRRTGFDDAVGAGAVAEELGDLPLALSAISALARRRRLTFQECLTKLVTYPVADVLGKGKNAEYPLKVAAAVLLAVDSVEGDGSIAPMLLEMVAKLSPDGVDRKLFVRLVPSVEEGWTDQEVEDGLERCVNASLLSWSQDGRSVIMHRLVGRIIRERTQVAGRSGDALRNALAMLEAGMSEKPSWQEKDVTLQLAEQIEALMHDTRASEEEETSRG